MTTTISTDQRYLDVSLHSGTPDAANEVDYAGYHRMRISRSTDWWHAVDGGTYREMTTRQHIDFPECRGGPKQTVTHFAIWFQGVMAFRGPLWPSIPVREGCIPRLRKGTIVTWERLE